MKRKTNGRIAFAALLSIVATGFASECYGQWGSYGSSGGSSGISYGSSGGSSGISYGSSGGSSGYWRTPVRSYWRWVAYRTRSNVAYWRSHGSSGYSSYGSSGGSSGYRRTYYSASSGGSSGTTVYYYRGGSSGGSSGGSPVISPGYSVPPSAKPAVEPPAPETTSIQTTSLLQNGYLTVSVPAGTKIYVNDKLTATTGTFRRYKTPAMDSGNSLSYQVKAVIEQDGKQIAQTKVVDLTSGDSKHLDFEFGTEPPPVTVLSLNVPDNAEVTLAGNRTGASGPTRLFTTTNLKKGEQWKDYKIVVAAEIDGRKVVRSKTIDLKAGESVDLDFDFPSSASTLASR